MLLEGKKIALQFQEQLKEKIQHFSERKPGLAVILVGDLAASMTYVKNKQRACEVVGIKSFLIELPASVDEQTLVNEIKKINANKNIDGILVQFPLPKQINASRIVEAIDPRKDVDCFHPINVGKLALADPSGFIPCTPKGIQILLKEANVDVAGKHVVILGRSHLVGMPLALLLMQKNKQANATVTVCHSQSKNLKEICLSADILVAAIGSPLFVKKEMVKEGAVVIDVGINRIEKQLVGDVDFENVAPKCSFITPVPGGVGPMTITSLLQNTVQSFHRSQL